MLSPIAMISVHTSPIARPGGAKTGGMNVYIRELAQEFARRNLQVDIYTRRTSADEDEITPISPFARVIHIASGPPVPMLPDRLFSTLPEFTRGVLSFAANNGLQYPIIYSHYWLSGWVANALRSQWGTPFVQMFHTLGHMKNRINAGANAGALSDQRILTETQITEWADRLIAATPAEQAQLLWLYRADRRKIEIISPGVNLERFHPSSPDEARLALGVPADVQMLLFVGRIEPLKAVDSILEAMRIAREQAPERIHKTRLLIIGGQPDDPADSELQRLKAYSQDLGLGDVTQFVGAKDQATLHLYYAAALAVIMPSDYESFGMVALEAMASGTPVIASQVGGLAYLVEDGQTGFLVPVREPQTLAARILTLLEDSTLHANMRQNAVERAKRYTWSTVADQVLSVFESVQAQR